MPELTIKQRRRLARAKEAARRWKRSKSPTTFHFQPDTSKPSPPPPKPKKPKISKPPAKPPLPPPPPSRAPVLIYSLPKAGTFLFSRVVELVGQGSQTFKFIHPETLGQHKPSAFTEEDQVPLPDIGSFIRSLSDGAIVLTHYAPWKYGNALKERGVKVVVATRCWRKALESQFRFCYRGRGRSEIRKPGFRELPEVEAQRVFLEQRVPEMVDLVLQNQRSLQVLRGKGIPLECVDIDTARDFPLSVGFALRKLFGGGEDFIKRVVAAIRQVQGETTPTRDVSSRGGFDPSLLLLLEELSKRAVVAHPFLEAE